MIKAEYMENEMVPQDDNSMDSLEDDCPFESAQENINNNNMNNGNALLPPQATLQVEGEHTSLSNNHVVLPDQSGHVVNICLDNSSSDLNSQSEPETATNLQMVVASSGITPYGPCQDDSSSRNANSHFHKSGYELDTVKSGDVEKERIIEERVKELGLWNNKRILEKQLYQQLARNIDEDGLFQAINKCKRKRPLRERVDSTKNEVINTVQPKLVKDDFGNNVAYKVNIIMGLFTHNVCHKIQNHSVTIQGSTPDNRSSKLYKEVTIEFPQNVDISGLNVCFNAGVFKCEAPFKVRNLSRLSKSFESVSSYLSEETESVTSSDLKSVEGVF